MKRLDKETVAKILELRQRGATYGAISEQTGVPEHAACWQAISTAMKSGK